MGRDLKLQAPCWDDLDTVRRWRNLTLASNRTPYLLTEEMQRQFYDDVICKRDKNSRWWSVYLNGEFISLIGVEKIEWENSLGELSLTINPSYTDCGLEVFGLLLSEGFGSLGLEALYKECYACDTNLLFWYKVEEKYKPSTVELPHRKRYKGKIYQSMHMTFTKAGLE